MKLLFFTLSMFFCCSVLAQMPKEKVENLVVNGDFESGNVGFRTDYIKGFTKDGYGHYDISKDAHQVSPDYFHGKGDGYFMVVDGANSPNKVVWEQTINVNPQTEYLFSCWLSTLNINSEELAKIQLYINNKMVGNSFKCPKKLNKWEQFSITWKSQKETTITIKIIDKNTKADANDFGLDNIKLSETIVENTPNLIVNGNFENGANDFRSDYQQNRNSYPGRYLITDDAHKFSSYYFQGKGDGNFMAVDGYNSRNKTVWEQTVEIKPQTEYLFSCLLLTLKNTGGSPASLQIYFNDQLLSNPFDCPTKLNQWEQFSATWKSNNETQVKIRIVDRNIAYEANDFGIDNIKLLEKVSRKQNTIVESVVKTEESVHKKTETNPSQEINNEDIINDKPVVLKNVLFETGRYEILPCSFDELDLLVILLNQNETMKILISGHTDNMGNKNDNKILSLNRANSVKEYLISKGINSERIFTKGFGDEKPIDNTGSQDGRKKNRRVEFQMIKQ